METLSGAALRPGAFSSRFHYAGQDERNFVIQIAKLAGKDRTRIHVLTDDQRRSYGFVAISVDVFDNRPSLVVDYLFVSLPFRGKSFFGLDSKISDSLLGYCVETGESLNELVPLRYIALLPSTEVTAEFYRRRGFRKLDATYWLFLRL